MALHSAVVGAGVVSDVHLSGLSECPLTELVAVCDVDERRAREKAAEYDVAGYAELDAMIAGEDLDWLHVCTPVQTHLELARTAIEAGIPVQIEKPITETPAEFDALEAAAAEHGVPVTAVHNHDFDVAMRAAMAAVADGEVGRVRGVDLLFVGETAPDYENRGAWAFDLVGGEFEEGLPHPLYLLLRSGGYPTSVDDVQVLTGLSREYEAGFAYDGLRLQYPSETGALCGTTVLAGSIPQRILNVHGEDGALVADLTSQALVRLDRNYWASPRARARNNLDRIADRLLGTVDNVLAVAERRFDGSWETKKELGSHYYQIDEEARALLTGDPMPVPLSEAGWTISLMDAIRESATDRSRTEPDAAAPPPGTD